MLEETETETKSDAAFVVTSLCGAVAVYLNILAAVGLMIILEPRKISRKKECVMYVALFTVAWKNKFLIKL